MLLGLALIAVPLLVAVLNAAVQMRQIASTSEKLVVESVRATRATQELFAEIAAVERGTRVYQVLRDPKLTESITRSEARLSTTRVELARHLRGPEATQALADLAAAESQLLSGIARPKPTDVDFASLLALLDVMQDAAARIAATGNAQIDAELTDRAVHQQLGALADIGERRLQFMRHVAQEAVALLRQIEQSHPQPFELVPEALEVAWA